MTEHGAGYDEALAEAQALGFAEADPTADVEGHDAGAKAAIIVSIAFGVRVVDDDVLSRGHQHRPGGRHRVCGSHGLFRIKLLGHLRAVRRRWRCRCACTRPCCPSTIRSWSVSAASNAVFVEGRAVGELMFYGRGAGGFPSASAVLGDVIDAAINLRNGTHGSLGALEAASIRAIDETSAEYLLGLDVADKPGVLHSVTGVFASHGVDIRVAEQEGNGPDARLVFITHSAHEADVQATVHELRDLDVVRNVGGLLRVIGD